MKFSPQLLDEIRARLPVSAVVSRRVALKKAGREWRGLSPFKAERTPSFFVNDQKGFYHCFASGAHGDIFKFVMETEGLSFPEAVERLAGEAGVPMPKPDFPRNEAQERAETDARSRLYALLEASAVFFEEQFRGAAGADARRYIERRGLKRETIATFRLGYAPGGRTVLKEHLARIGYTPAEMAQSGMIIAGEDVATPYDRFRNRVMFPITDAKGRIIAFGGRALDPDQPAKYLNSPETPLFHKGAVLFNAARARPIAFDRDRVIAVEGYMDVIALSEAGFGETVAPLGTALTEGQIQLLWRMAREPILCFDGDSAGRRAAFRAVETALPLLKPGFSVQFAFLPDGLDPDDLIRQQGADAFERVLGERTQPLFDVLMERETAEDAGSTPERRAALEMRLKQLIAKIGDETVRSQYETELRQTLWERNRREIQSIVGAGGRRGTEMAGRRRNNAQADWRQRERAHVTRSAMPARPTVIAVASNELAAHTSVVPQREALILRTLLNHPWLIEDAAEEVATLTFSQASLGGLRDELLAYVSDEKTLDRDELSAHLTNQGLSKVVALVERAITHKGDKFAEPEADRAAVELGWRHIVLLQRREELRQQMDMARRAFEDDGSEESFSRIQELHAQLTAIDGQQAFSDSFEG